MPTDLTPERRSAFKALREVVREFESRGRQPVPGGIKSKLQQGTVGGFDERRLGFSSFSPFLAAAEEAGFVVRAPTEHGHTLVTLTPLPAAGGRSKGRPPRPERNVEVPAELEVEGLRQALHRAVDRMATSDLLRLPIPVEYLVGIGGFLHKGAKHGGTELETVRAAVESARARSQHLVFLDEALRSADASPFVRPQGLYEALLILDRVAADYGRDELGAGFEAAFAKAGLTGFASDISETAKNCYRRDYTVRYGDRQVLLGPHLRFGRGTPHSCARIYWYVDRDQRLLVVGHVGRHLRDTTSGPWLEAV